MSIDTKSQYIDIMINYHVSSIYFKTLADLFAKYLPFFTSRHFYIELYRKALMEHIIMELQLVYSETCDERPPHKTKEVVLYNRWSFIRRTNYSNVGPCYCKSKVVSH